MSEKDETARTSGPRNGIEGRPVAGLIRRLTVVPALALATATLAPALMAQELGDSVRLATAGTMPATPAAPGAGGVLRPGDLVRLRIWREPDLSGDFQVDDRGSAVFPKIGPVHVASISADSLKSMLIGVYSTYLRNPSIDVTLLRRVNVLGSVRNPGLYPVDATMTVADALALAGGVTTEGDQNKLDLRRDGRTLRADLSQRTRIGDSPIRSGDQLYVPQRSWMSRNTGVVTALISATGFLAATLIAR